MKPTREDRLNKKVTHAEYYRAIAKTAGIKTIGGTIDMKKVRAALDSGDKHLNTIPLASWDRVATWLLSSKAIHDAFKSHGDYATLAGTVCLIKQFARDNVQTS